jgi:hypothetical protein
LGVSATDEVRGVEIEFRVDWYDGPVSGVATHRGQARWFEAEPGFDPDVRTRQLFLYPLSAEELARERELNRLYEEHARGKPAEEWPAILLERDWELPTEYAARASVGWFYAG